MWQNAHVYIFHSIDYGKTFEVFHPFAKGNAPVLANFSTDTTEGEMPFTVDFCNFSIGDIQQYEWDFENDGIIDSYEQSPVHTYQDTGYYSVRLTITGADSSNTFLKENYVHVYKTIGFSEHVKGKFQCYPNPSSGKVMIEFTDFYSAAKVLISDITGSLIKTIDLQAGMKKLTWDTKDKQGNYCKPGIYFIKLEKYNHIQKVILTN